jgi:hypothetical protein
MLFACLQATPTMTRKDLIKPFQVPLLSKISEKLRSLTGAESKQESIQLAVMDFLERKGAESPKQPVQIEEGGIIDIYQVPLTVGMGEALQKHTGAKVAHKSIQIAVIDFIKNKESEPNDNENKTN